jgi:hypothetical protein
MPNLIIVLAADLDDLEHELVAVGGALGAVHVLHQLLDNLHQVLPTDHAVEKVEGAEADRLV